MLTTTTTFSTTILAAAAALLLYTGWAKKTGLFLAVCNSRMCWHRIAFYISKCSVFIRSKTDVLYVTVFKYSLRCSYIHIWLRNVSGYDQSVLMVTINYYYYSTTTTTTNTTILIGVVQNLQRWPITCDVDIPGPSSYTQSTECVVVDWLHTCYDKSHRQHRPLPSPHRSHKAASSYHIPSLVNLAGIPRLCRRCCFPFDVASSRCEMSIGSSVHQQSPNS